MDDPQCLDACSKCKACVSVVQTITKALNNMHPLNQTGNSSKVLPFEIPEFQDSASHPALDTFAMCLQLGATQAATPQGSCLSKAAALCRVGDMSGSCNSLSDVCQRQDACGDFNVETCDTSKPNGQGRACQVMCC
jgi:hypothetical protein